MALRPCGLGFRIAASALACLALHASAASAAEPAEADLHGVFRLEGGLVLPYPLDNLFRGWVECTGNGKHKALDIGGVGEDGGLGSAVRAVGKGKVIQIGMPSDDPERFGAPFVADDTVVRSGKRLPAWKDVPGYGKVHFFTRNYGRHRSGGIITLKLLAGPLAGHEVHYLHLAAARPDLTVGSDVEAGEELGLLGGTAVMDSPPHLHFSIETSKGQALDIGRLFGIGATRVPCRAGASLTKAVRGRYTVAAKALMSALRSERTLNQERSEPIASCGPHSLDGDFAGGDILSQRFPVAPPETSSGEPAPLTLTLERLEGKAWSPRIQIEDSHGEVLFTGTLSRPEAKKRFRFQSKASGRRGTATVIVTPQRPDEGLVVRAMAWPTHKRARAKAAWRLTIDRACPTAAERNDP